MQLTREQKLTVAAITALTLLIFIIGFMSIGSQYFFKYWENSRLIKKYLLEGQELSDFREPTIRAYDPIVGKRTADVIIYEYADFTCPRCATVQPVISSIKKKYGDRVALVFKGIPINQHPERYNALEAALCAHEQQAFDPYYEYLFQNQSILSHQTYLTIAQEAGLDMESFTECISAERYADYLDTAIGSAISEGVQSTPTVIIGDHIEEEIFTESYLDRLIQNELNS